MKRLGIAVLFALAVWLLACGPALASPSFSDVPQASVFHDYVTKLADQEIVSGFPDGSFHPYDFITRQQLAKMIVLAAHVSIEDATSTPTFTDLSPDLGRPYPYDYVVAMFRAGFFVPMGDTARPLYQMTRAHLAIVLVRAGGSHLQDPPPGYTGGYDDPPNFSADDVLKAKYNGLLDGVTTASMEPFSLVTRGQACKAVARLMERLNSGASSPVIRPLNGGPGTPEYDGIPWPIVDGNVEGWWQYPGNGRFVTDSGREFFWRDGRFVNPDGTLMEIPPSVKEHLHLLGIDHQPTIPPVLSADKAALADEVETIRKGLIAGTLVFDWAPAAGSDFPSDPRQALDDLEASSYRPDVYVYLKDSAGQPDALIQELDRTPEVEYLSFTSKEKSLARLKADFKDNPELYAQLQTNPVPALLEIWLKDYRQSAEFAEKLKGRPEVDEAKAPSMDFVLWTGLLREMTHSKE